MQVIKNVFQPHGDDRGQLVSLEEFKNIPFRIKRVYYMYDTKEGVVVRRVHEFGADDFSKNVVKYVRENHVQTDEHWTKNWKRAKLITETI